MNIKNLYVMLTLKELPEKFPVEAYQKNQQSGNNELLITLFGQKVWVDAQSVRLLKGQGSTYCWKDYEKGRYVELTEGCAVCPACGWWKCPECGSCRCNKPAEQN